MTKRTKYIYILGSVAICVILAAIVLLALFAGGGTGAKKPALVILSGSEEFVYDGTAHANNDWELAGGELAAGQRIVVEFTGSRTDAGTSNNTFAAKVLDGNGANVSSEYAIEYRFGTLTVVPVSISLSTRSGTKVYDGTALSCPEYSVTSQTGLLAGHTFQSVKMPAARVDVGVSENYISEIVVSDGARDVSSNYKFIYHYGELTVTPRNLTVRSGSAEKKYDGLPLTCEEWEIVSLTQPVGGQKVSVGISGERQSVGESPNTISEVAVFDGVKNVTNNYAITEQEGVLVVTGDAGGQTPGGEGEKLNTDGKIEGGPNGQEGEIQAALRVQSDIGGRMYLRLTSFGAYDGKKWAEAKEYPQLLDGKYGFNYLTGAALKANGYDSARIRIDAMGGDYVLPYYMDAAPLKYTIQSSDVTNRGDVNVIYELYFYSYDFVKDGALSAGLGAYAGAERAYAEFVREQYLSVPASTNGFLQSLIKREGFQKSDPDIVKKVADYIQKAAKYNADYNRLLDRESDIVVSFLRDYQEGICQHYASAATLLFRALGIPARYTIGYAGNVSAGAWSPFYSSNAHAWTEVYLDGTGWVQVEVTGTGPALDGSGSSGGGGGGGGSVPGGNYGTLRIKPINEYMKFDGVSTLVPSGKIQGISEYLQKGYTYTANVKGSRRDAGIGESTISSFCLINPSGEDVTDLFTVEYSKGKLQVYLVEISISTEGGSKLYDGTPLANPAWKLGGELLFGHTASVKVVGGRTDVGRSLNETEVRITDANGKDVTQYYKINADYGVLEVTPRSICVTAGSSEKTYDGAALTNKYYVIQSEYETPLAQGQTAAVTVIGSQTEVGRCDNVVSSVVILDDNGNDVTANYTIEIRTGTLIVYHA